jgi:hypothetical protein
MRTVTVGIALLALAIWPALPSGPAAHASTSLTCKGLGQDVHWSDRRDPDDARIAITTEDGEMALLLTDRDVVMQLSDRALRRVNRELRDAKDEQDNWLASAIVTAVTGTVRELLDHSFVCHVRDLRDVSYEDGRLVFIGRHGRAVFGNEDACDSDASRAFSERDARNFMREFRRVKAGQ